jgi:hypothetical protein
MALKGMVGADDLNARPPAPKPDSVDRVTPSLLAKAFRGELVLTEATLADVEGREYETAERLLEKVRERRTTTPTSKSKTKPKWHKSAK